MKIYDSKYQNLIYKSENQTFYNTFFEETQHWTEFSYKADFLAFVKEMVKYKGDKIVVDMRKFCYTVEPRLQEWHNENVFVPTMNQIKKVAIVVSSDLFSQISVEQTMQEGTAKQFITLYFDEVEKAEKWLLSL